MKRMSRRLDHHVVEPETGHGNRTSAAVALSIGGSQIAAESRVEVLDHPNLPVGGGFRRETENLRRALVLVAGAERTLGLSIG